VIRLKKVRSNMVIAEYDAEEVRVRLLYSVMDDEGNVIAVKERLERIPSKAPHKPDIENKVRETALRLARQVEQEEKE